MKEIDINHPALREAREQLNISLQTALRGMRAKGAQESTVALTINIHTDPPCDPNDPDIIIFEHNVRLKVAFESAQKGRNTETFYVSRDQVSGLPVVFNAQMSIFDEVDNE